MKIKPFSGACGTEMPRSIAGIRAERRVKPLDLDISALSKAGECAPISEDILNLWDPSIRAADAGESNVIEIYGTIGEDWWTGEGVTSKSVSTALRQFGDGDIEVRINSPGGDMFEGISIYNILAQHRGAVSVRITGLAASAASIIAMAGDKIAMGLGSFVMIHNCWVMAIGNRHDMKEVAKYLEPFDEALRDIYVARTGNEAALVEKWMDKEKMFSANEAKENGFADEIMSKDALAQDAKAAETAKVFNAARIAESRLCRKSGMTRSAARALISELKGKPGAAHTATHDAGDDWMAAAKEFMSALSA